MPTPRSRPTRGETFDALVLDVMMPGRSGLDVLRELRREAATPVLMLTALGEDIDRILGLELGADDYIPKPCNPRELAARLRAVLRRARGEGGEALTDLRNGPIWLRASSRSVTVDEKPVALTATEFDLLALAAARSGPRRQQGAHFAERARPTARAVRPLDRRARVEPAPQARQHRRRHLADHDDPSQRISVPPARRTGVIHVRAHFARSKRVADARITLALAPIFRARCRGD